MRNSLVSSVWQSIRLLIVGPRVRAPHEAFVHTVLFPSTSREKQFPPSCAFKLSTDNAELSYLDVLCHAFLAQGLVRWSCKPKVPSSNLGGGFPVQSNLTPFAPVSSRLPPGLLGLSGISVLTSHSFTGLPVSPALPVSAASTCIHGSLVLFLFFPPRFRPSSSFFLIFFCVALSPHRVLCLPRWWTPNGSGCVG